jgi:hypothetical protein
MPDEITMAERVARAIESVNLISRYDDWTSDRVEGFPIEVLMVDPGGVVDDNVIVARFAGPKNDCSRRREEVLRILRAKAAIEAMRTPTGGMEDWFRDNLEHTETGAWIWKGAIDAALKERG